ncbi:Asp-tRNA(Asn)/Glu-tRNA(Gln) amidotransferase subunit GatC [Zwartia panacis]|uniref:Asp-tRNA(Asn)/Glu-tRNA(Gln) amidotransferase subunit GatC n=1 Tax=Zwartia panacis TaxID=2683345 RepID=UPI0025B3A4F5|nr:Asp-tRNA(Asn)/Glu-tRNA(Gln) amidotransferase subunit GatC [Zwartia panacis]MDN4016281.1 Asp-tRNA(Asn)/Glu-tRNA(Gln) amidotransferase subunit GatC [Zwartia panacis]
MALTDQEVARIARLARLHLTPEQQDQAQTDLNKILGIIETLQSVDTTGIEPLAHPLASVTDIHLRLREDVVTEVSSTERREALMANAPGASKGLFLVPKVIE